MPISPDFDLNALVKNTSNFDWVTRLSTEKLKEHSPQSFEALVQGFVIQGGRPLVIEDWGSILPQGLFSRAWLEKFLGTKPEKVRDISNAVDIHMTIGHYLRSMGQLTKQFTASHYKDPKQQRLYLKDIDCPELWAQQLERTIPEPIYYLNECVESATGGDGAIREPNEYGQMHYGKGVAPAGDLMSSLPPEMQALNMMCYIGHEGTYTPAHREMCASLGQNIMVEASQEQNGEKAGSSIWFMTETKEREVVSEHFLSMLGHDIEVEKHFAQVNAWKKAPFNVWVVEQKVGDLILIPPLAPHQVWNRGARTMKVAWNRTTVDTLELALHEALPRARLVCRDEQYKNKAIIYYTLCKYHDLLQRDTIEPKMWKYGRIKQLLDDFRRLFLLYTEILVSEMFSPKLPEEENVEFLSYDSNVTCSYCRCNIFNRFLTCKSCIEYGLDGEEDTYDICMDCYAMGRSCACISNLNWVEQWKWSTLLQKYGQWRDIVVQSDGFFDTQRSPQPLEIARKRYGKKPIAEVCQEQLRKRPWNDPKNPTARELSPGMSDVEPEVDDEGRPKNRGRSKFSKTGKGRVAATKNKTRACHICCHHDWNWRLAFCTTCKNAYCYGVLWRAFDLMPQTVMEDKDWQCPKCLKICSCGKCRKSDTQHPYAPKGTLLGHDTRAVADIRSVESLVDFSRTNLNWLRDGEDDPYETARMKRLKEKAEAEKARVDTTNKSYIEDSAPQDPLSTPVVSGDAKDMEDMNDIDPALRDTGVPTSGHVQTNNLCQSPYPPVDPILNGLDMNHLGHTNGPEVDRAFEWDGHCDIDEDDAYHRQNNLYQDRLLVQEACKDYSATPITPVFSSASSYPDPSHLGHIHSRMMGAGYYQQDNGADRILYDPPNADGFRTEPSQPEPAMNAYMALSDHLAPPPEVVKIKKRKIIGTDDTDEGDFEFFTSKTKKAKEVGEMNHPPTPEPPQRKPSRSIMKPKAYKDLGNGTVVIENDESSPGFSHGRKIPKLDGSLAIALALHHADKSATKEPTLPKRRGTRTHASDINVSVTNTTPKSNPSRQSTWLTQKKAQEQDEEYHSEKYVPTRICRGRPQEKKQPTAVRPSSSTNDEEDRGVDLDTSSLFGEPIEQDKSDEPIGSAASSDPFGEQKEMVYWSSSKPNSRVTAGKPVSSEVGDSAPKKRGRGRPPKKPLQLPTLEISPPAVVPKHPSLIERVTLKREVAKTIVTEPQIATRAFSTAASSWSTPLGAISRLPKDTIPATSSGQDLRSSGPVDWTSVNRLKQPSNLHNSSRSSGPATFKLLDGINLAATAPTSPSARKGPAVGTG